jgi:hypothetical protein
VIGTPCCALTVALLSIAPMAPPLDAQQARAGSPRDETTAIMTAAATYVRPQLSPGALVVEVDDSTQTGTARATSVARSLDGRAGKIINRCSGPLPSDCHLADAAAAIRIMMPIVRGDTATVDVRIWEETTSTRQPVHHALLVVRLVRNGEAWLPISGRMRWTS